MSAEQAANVEFNTSLPEPRARVCVCVCELIAARLIKGALISYRLYDTHVDHIHAELGSTRNLNSLSSRSVGGNKDAHIFVSLSSFIFQLQASDNVCGTFPPILLISHSFVN